MGSDWVDVSIDDIKATTPRSIAIGPFGSRMKADVYTACGIPVIRGTNITARKSFAGEFVYVSAETADDLVGCNVYEGDLVFPHRGAIGIVGLVPPNGPGRFIMSSSLMKLTCNRNLADPDFVYYYFRSEAGRSQLLKYASTVGTPGIGQPLSSLRSIRLRMPSVPGQRKIASILGALDDKIELNRKTARTLEEMAQALFRSWFVDFDPVIDNALAAGNPIPAEYKERAARRQDARLRAEADGRPFGLPEEQAKLFPDAFEDSGLGPIPGGWQVRAFGTFIHRLPVGKKFDQKTVSAKGAVPVLDQGRSGIIGYHDEQPGVSASVQMPVIVFANHTCYMRLVWSPFSTIQNVLPFVGRGVNTLWAYLATKDRQQFIEYKGHWPDFCRKETALPGASLTDHMGQLVQPLLLRVSEAECQTGLLTQIRDSLLPKLISGEIEVDA